MAQNLETILDKIKQLRGIDFSCYRRNTLIRRVSARLAKLGMEDYARYLELLENDPTECDKLIDTIAINVSSFFRNPIVCEILAQTILPQIIEKKRSSGSQNIRIWSAGCAGGEEAYSQAILIQEALKKDPSEWTVHVFATDIDKESLRRAAKADYPRQGLLNVKLGILDEYFDQTETGYMVKPEIRKMVRFSNEDLTSSTTFAPKESVFGEFDIIFCRNVLIYFNADLQHQVTNKLVRSLSSSGYLILGDSERLDNEVSTYFKVVDHRNRIYKKRIT